MMKKSWNNMFRRIVCPLFAAALLLGSCGPKKRGGEAQGAGKITELGRGSHVLRIVSGSENRVLEPILQKYADAENIRIEMNYRGSLDIMRLLQSGKTDCDAVWPASSLWLNVGDTQHLVKHAASVSITPVVFGIRRSKAEELGFVGREVSVSDILQAVQDKKLSFCMTSASQSNSGASALIGFLYAFLGNPEVITAEDLKKEELKAQMRALLSGVDRQSGSSDWLKEMFLAGDYDAMVNYECLIIDANQELERRGSEPLELIYPYDGLSIADSPLGYVDRKDREAEKRFLKLQEYLLSEEIQNEIQRTGRRTAYTGVSEENADVFREEWGVQKDRVLSPIRMPSEEVLMQALALYQTEFKKPALNIYCCDFSGSMSGKGNKQLVKAMEQLLIQKNAEKNLLQASALEVNIFLPFDTRVLAEYRAEGNGAELEELYQKIADTKIGGGTDMYAALSRGMEILEEYDLSQYTPAFILLTDGESYNIEKDDFLEKYEQAKNDIPIFSIMFGSADPKQLEELAAATNARVFDGRDDLVRAFQSVKGYN